MKYIDADRLRAEINRLYQEHSCRDYCDEACSALDRLDNFIDSLQQDKESVELELCSQTWWEERGWIMIPPDATIEDIELLHTFLYAVKNNKQGMFTFTRLSDEQYKEVLRRFKKAKEEQK